MDLAKWSQQATVGISGGNSNAVADGFSKAVEFVATPLFFGVGGHFLDKWLGTSPIFTVILFVWALTVTVGMSIRDYNQKMRAEEDRLMGRRQQLKGAE